MALGDSIARNAAAFVNLHSVASVGNGLTNLHGNGLVRESPNYGSFLSSAAASLEDTRTI
jgi:hypothetical protein